MAGGADAFILTALTTDPALAASCDRAGVDRIGVDIERLGKRERQGHIADARISDHTIDDLRRVVARLARAVAFIRINPLHDGSRAEIDAAIAAGARAVMLPYFHSAEAPRRFVDLVAGRAAPLLLIETAAAAADVEAVVAVPGIVEVMVGLNDLHRDLGLPNHFSVFGLPLMDRIAACVCGAGLGFGFGGVAHPADTSLPVAPDLVYAEYARLGARSAWLSRAFFRHLGVAGDLDGALATLRARLAYWRGASTDALARQHAALLAAAAR